MMRYFLAVVALALVGGCVTEFRVEDRLAKLTASWQESHPGEAVTPEVVAELKATAQAQVEAEVKAEREEALAKAGSAGANALTGNWFAAAFDVVGLVMLAFGARKPKIA